MTSTRSWTNRPGPLIVCYHGLGGSDGLSEDAFARSIDALLERRVIVPLGEALESLGDRSAGNIAAVTFDDGYTDYLDLAVPLLESRGVHATLFVPAGHIGGTNVWDKGLREERTVLSAEALRDLDPKTTDVGVHGYSHCRLRDLSADELYRETAQASMIIEEVCERAPRFFAYPYGLSDDFDRPAERAVEHAGLSAACSAMYGRGSRTKDRFRLRRVTIEATDTLEVVEHKLAGRYDWWALKEQLGATLRRAGLRS